mmetsp:Transcript_17739/g.17067  ORF Transcript_17739/g.17067 Transcript_17739/m.17067 type:complete len:188 (-) Transcript_17739:158-721(-)
MTGFLNLLSILVTVLSITEGFKILPSNVLKPRSNLALDGSRDNLSNVLITASIGIATLFSPLSVLAEETAPIEAVKVEKVVEKEAKDNTFRGFVAAMENKQLTKVVFHGINPNSATILYKDGTLAEVSSFPPDDPRGPSGPVQVMQKCAHTPGIICQQDISDALRFAKSSSYNPKSLNTMIRSNPSI